MDKATCPLCGTDDAKVECIKQSSREKHYEIMCPRCGNSAITDKALDWLNNNATAKLRFTQLAYEKFTKDLLSIPKRDKIPLQDDLEKDLFPKMLLIIENDNDKREYLPYPIKTISQVLKNYPQTLTEKLDRALCNIGRMQSYCLNNPFTPDEKYMFAESVNEAKYYSQMLINAGFCVEYKMGTLGNLMPNLQLTLEGWKKFEDLERNWQNSTTAFIAMWFNEATVKYREAVKEAILQAGYEPQVIDEYEHNNFIMDEVINKINEAKFVIADFTCIPEQPENNSKIPGGVRGGVYFEAGYAKGLGKEVIITCRDDDDSKKRRHFDIDQLNTLFWKEQDGKLVDSNGKDFVHRLAERIKATVGKGKLMN